MKVIPALNRLLPHQINTRIYWKFLKRLNHLFIKDYEAIPVKISSTNLFIKGLHTDTIAQQIFFQGYYEYALSRLVIETAKTGGVMVDVGANIGYFSLLFASIRKSNMVYAFEPSQRNLKYLSHNVAFNGLENVRIIEKAVADYDGYSVFNCGPEDQTGWGHLTKDTVQNSSNLVEVVTLGEYFRDLHTEIELVKIDVEGADLQVILGCETLIRKKLVKKIVFEYHHDLEKEMTLENSVAQQVSTLIKENGYSIKYFSANTFLIYV